MSAECNLSAIRVQYCTECSVSAIVQFLYIRLHIALHYLNTHNTILQKGLYMLAEFYGKQIPVGFST